MASGPEIATTCPYCGVGCGVLARPDGAGGASVAGDARHPANFGKLCVKGAALGDTLGLEGRLLAPQIQGREATWAEATALTAERFAAAIRDHGPDSVAFYVSGQLLTEDYYVANKLMKGFIGSANIDTNSRLCMASSVAGHKRALGADIVPGLYEDFDHADVIVLVGSNLAWCHPVLYQRIAEVKRARPGLRVINIDPRRTATSELADQHLAIAPGGDVALFLGLFQQILARGADDPAFIAAHTEGFEETAEAAGALSETELLARTGLSAAERRAFYDAWIGTQRVVTIYSQGVNQWSTGVDKVSAILNCHLATGRIGRPGTGPFSVTGQPNAMGGREVGGLSNMLAAHMALENPTDRDRVRRFWRAPRMAETPGLKAVDLFRSLGEGRIKALWVMATNPAVSLPDADAVARAIEGGAFVAVSDIMARTDTTRLAHVLLPATGWGEKDGTVTNSERRISRQRPFLPAPGAARHDWAIIADVARQIGAGLGENWSEAFDYHSPAAVFREHAALSGFENDGARGFDISAYAALSDADYASMTPFLWPAPAGPRRTGLRFFAGGGFLRPGGKAALIPLRPRDTGEALTAEFPLVLNTGRVRDQWHTMTRTAKSAKLSRHIGEPYVEIHPEDADRFGLAPASLARIESRLGAMLARVVVTDRQRPGSIFAPMHWTGETASRGRVDALVTPVVDPISGQPESKRTPVRIRPYRAAWYGFAATREEPELVGGYWAKARAEHGWRIELAGETPLDDPSVFAARLLGGASASPNDLMAYDDKARGVERFALFDGATALGALFLSPEPVAVAREWLAAAFGDGRDHRLRLLAGRGGADLPDEGPVLCVCHHVGTGRILEAIAGGAGTVDAVGEACAAGTNCGSCRPEIAALLKSGAPKIAAE